jgi:hypothetical protein
VTPRSYNEGAAQPGRCATAVTIRTITGHTGEVVPKSLLLPTLVVLAIFAAACGLITGAGSAHGLLFVGLCVAFAAGDRSLWSRT